MIEHTIHRVEHLKCQNDVTESFSCISEAMLCQAVNNVRVTFFAVSVKASNETVWPQITSPYIPIF